jgi:hypothetical protein
VTNFDRFTRGGHVVVQGEEGLKTVTASFRADIKNTPIVKAEEAGLPNTLRITRTQTADQAGPRTIQMSLRLLF